MKKINILLLFLFSLFYTQTQAQQRYVDPIFPDVVVTQNLVYGVNATVILLQQVGQAIPQPLIMDLYEPAGDAETERPLVLLFHSGTFLPFPQNTLSNGTLRDSAVVDVATKLAQRGYVVASCDYRLGWNPIAPTQDERVYGIMNAAYRAIQDARTAIRYFKYVAAEIGNIYGIDPNKIVLWGLGTGGYMSMGSASLDDYLEIATLPKFNINVGGNPVPVVLEGVNGNIWGTSVGISPGAPLPFPAGDTLCYPNHVGYSSDFQLSVNFGGAIGDTTWVDENTVPGISLHVPTDPVTPYGTALVTLGAPFFLPIVEVSGSYDFQRMQQVFNNHEEWEDINWIDDITAVADSRNDGLEGLFPVLTDSVENAAPWDWWSASLAGQFGPPDPITAKATIDSAITYFAPRACIILGLGCDLEDYISALNEVESAKIDLKVSPNPATDYVKFVSKEYPIQDIYVYDLQGRLVKVHTDVNSYDFNMYRNSLDSGMYIAQVRFEHGFISKQIVFQN